MFLTPRSSDVLLGLACRYAPKHVVYTCCHFGLPLKNVWVSVIRVHGLTRQGNVLATVLIADPQPEHNYLLSRLFTKELRREQVTRVPLLLLRRVLRGIRDTSDLTIARVDHYSAGYFRNYIATPEWLDAVLDIPESPLAVRPGNKNLREDMRVIRRNKLSPEISHAEIDLERFYRTMHVPFTEKRHGAQAATRSLQ